MSQQKKPDQTKIQLDKEREQLEREKAALEREREELSEIQSRMEKIEGLLAERTPDDKQAAYEQGQEVIAALKSAMNPFAFMGSGANATGERVELRRGDWVARFTNKGGDGRFRGAWFKVPEGTKATPAMPTVGIWQGEWDGNRGQVKERLEYDSGIGLISKPNYKTIYKWMDGECVQKSDNWEPGDPRPERIRNAEQIARAQMMPFGASNYQAQQIA